MLLGGIVVYSLVHPVSIHKGTPFVMPLHTLRPTPPLLRPSRFSGIFFYPQHVHWKPCHPVPHLEGLSRWSRHTQTASFQEHECSSQSHLWFQDAAGSGNKYCVNRCLFKPEREPPPTETIVYLSSVMTNEFTGVTYGNMSEGFHEEHRKLMKDRILRNISPSQQLFTACVPSERARLLESFQPSNRELPALSIVEHQWTQSCAADGHSWGELETSNYTMLSCLQPVID